jgi:alkylhydroperoxidase family enzyme
MSTPSNSPRIAPLAPPYEPDTDAMLRKWMPPGSALEPLKLFRTLARHPELASRMRPLGSAILGHGLVDAREREIVIHRTCARAGAEYEWGVHAVAFAKPLGFSDDQIAATVVGDATDTSWSQRNALLIRMADELHDTATVSAELWAELTACWTQPQLLELLVIAGFYRLLAYVIKGASIELEPWAARFPQTATGSP